MTTERTTGRQKQKKNNRQTELDIGRVLGHQFKWWWLSFSFSASTQKIFLTNPCAQRNLCLMLLTRSVVFECALENTAAPASPINCRLNVWRLTAAQHTKKNKNTLRWHYTISVCDRLIRCKDVEEQNRNPNKPDRKKKSMFILIAVAVLQWQCRAIVQLAKVISDLIYVDAASTIQHI